MRATGLIVEPILWSANRPVVSVTFAMATEIFALAAKKEGEDISLNEEDRS